MEILTKAPVNTGTSEMKKVLLNAFEVESEPGDGTHYSYYALVIGIEIFFFPNRSTFRFPISFSIFDVHRDTDYSYPPNEDALKDARHATEISGCNVMTALECLRTAYKIVFDETNQEDIVR